MTPISDQRSRGVIRSSRIRGRKWGRGFERLEDRALLATFAVNSLLDTVDANPGDGMALDAAGQTSLRAAIMEANALAGNDIINLPAGTYSITLAGREENIARTGDFDVLRNSRITITGAGSAITIIDAAAMDRVFHVFADATLGLTGVTVRNGNAGLGPHPDEEGGAFYNAGTLTLGNCIVSGSSAAIAGGAIFNTPDGTLTLNDCMVWGNTVESGVRGGGGIANSGALTIVNSTISENVGAIGGGIENAISGTATIVSSTIAKNSLRGPISSGGGGIHNSGAISIASSTISENTTSSGFTRGGGILNESGVMTITNTTISGNSAYAAGGIQNNGQITALNSTITANFTISYSLPGSPGVPGGVAGGLTL
jgi:hypothetical protein